MHASSSRDEPTDPCELTPAASLWGRGAELRVAVFGGGPVAESFADALETCSGALHVGATAPASRDDLVIRTDADAVIVAVPVHERARFARRALEGGRHVLVVAPLATSAADAQALIELAREKDRVLGVGNSPRHDGDIQTLRAMVRKGRLGALQTFETVRATRALADPLWDLAPRDLATLLWLRGLPETVAAECTSDRGSSTPTSAHLTLRYSGGFVARITCKQQQLVERHRTTLTTRRGTLACEDGAVTVHGDIDADAVPAPFRSESNAAPCATRSELADFIECIETDAEPLSDAVSALEVIQLVELARASLERGGEALCVP